MNTVGIHGDNDIEPIEFKGDVAIIGDQVFSKKGGELREKLVSRVKQLGFEMFIRSNAYTWFNRFVAIRYMELHDFLDHGFRVLSNPNGSDTPEILEHATDVELPGLDKKKVIELRLAGDKDNELYRMLIIAQCNALNNAMPFLFEKIDNEAELLLPDNLLHSSSPVRKMVTQIDENLWNDVEIIGWIYQFYISEKKDEVIGKVVKSEDIPAATQLFTPNWIVKYMVQNTLGRMWMATYPDSALKDKMAYYIEPAEQESEVQDEIDATTPKELNPEELTFLDPACGSGHILVEAYDILKEIYLERGYRTRDIPRLILEKNLYGLDIDNRAAQLACFAVLMRARQDDRRLFNRNDLRLNIMSIAETKGFDKNKLLDAVSKREGGKGVWIWINELVELFEDAKTFGSLITVPDELSAKLNNIKSVIETEQPTNDDIFNYIAGTELESLRPIEKQAKILTKRYDCVVANPPYMGNNGMHKKLKKWAKIKYPDSKTDLFAMFIKRNLNFLKFNANVAMVTMQSWMFLSSFEKFRNFILNNYTIASMAHLGARAFGSISGEVVSTTAFIISNIKSVPFKGSYLRLVDGKNEAEKAKILREYFNYRKLLFYSTASNLKKIPGAPIAYWVSEQTISAFNQSKLGEKLPVKSGLTSGDKQRFVRNWVECDLKKINFRAKNNERNALKWFPHNDGGPVRKWYGNRLNVINWELDGLEIKNFEKSTIRSPQHYLKSGITWSDISTSFFAARHLPIGSVFENTGSLIIISEDEFHPVLGYICSKVAKQFMDIMNPTLHYGVGEVAKLPLLSSDCILGVNDIVSKCLKYTKTDWDSYEISWEFSTLPLLQYEYSQALLELNYTQLRNNWKNIAQKVKAHEEQNNRIFIKAYDLQHELIPDVPLSEITLNCNPNYRYGKGKTEKEYEALLLTDTMRELISYAIGCMMGRYSLDKPGLIYAHSGNIDFDPSKYKRFPADDDGIIPIMDMAWFEDDATKRFVEFIKTAWPPETLDENLKFIADSLKPKTNESPENTIRRYLSTTFFKDHMKTYKKRPIYWLFSSGKQKAFECLVYLHRYNDSTLSRMRSSYVTPLQGNISARIDFLGHEKDASTAASAQKKIQKQIDILKKKQLELKAFDDELRHYADMKICLDLDDGVKVNYGKFGNLLAQKKAITGKK